MELSLVVEVEITFFGLLAIAFDELLFPVVSVLTCLLQLEALLSLQASDVDCLNHFDLKI